MEWEGDGCVALAAKTYISFNRSDPSKNKVSSKGINKAIKLSTDHFKRVLDTRESSSHTNKGFIMKDRYMFTYEMARLGLPYFYCKRKVLDNGISTTYLDI